MELKRCAEKRKISPFGMYLSMGKDRSSYSKGSSGSSSLGDTPFEILNVSFWSNDGLRKKKG